MSGSDLTTYFTHKINKLSTRAAIAVKRAFATRTGELVGAEIDVRQLVELPQLARDATCTGKARRSLLRGINTLIYQLQASGLWAHEPVSLFLWSSSFFSWTSCPICVGIGPANVFPDADSASGRLVHLTTWHTCKQASSWYTNRSADCWKATAQSTARAAQFVSESDLWPHKVNKW